LGLRIQSERKVEFVLAAPHYGDAQFGEHGADLHGFPPLLWLLLGG